METDPSTPNGQGTVHRLGVKARVPGEHGLPKPEVLSARVTDRGLEGDYNVYREEERHGDPAMALLFLPLETIEQLTEEGWPVRPGDLGENVTTRGIPYRRLEPGTRLRFGSAEAEISKACTPCDNLHLLPYVGRAKEQEFLRTTLDRRGWYARVLRPGAVQRGDAIVLL